MTNYEVTTFDVCQPGFERLRNQDEFLLVASVQNDTTRDAMIQQFIEDLQACDRPAGFDYDACRTAIRDCCQDINMTYVLAYVEPATEEDEEAGCTAYLYIREVEA